MADQPALETIRVHSYPSFAVRACHDIFCLKDTLARRDSLLAPILAPKPNIRGRIDSLTACLLREARCLTFLPLGMADLLARTVLTGTTHDEKISLSYPISYYYLPDRHLGGM